ncbi:MAG: tannase/feruloyl esterase family alpha/beta hydrolase [Pseudohongiellaceae bacterium]
MKPILRWALISACISCFPVPGFAQSATSQEAGECEALLHTPNLTITFAGLRDNPQSGAYCYVRGIIAPAIQFHAQLPLPEHWNGRFLQWGDGGKDGDLDFADHRVAEGYAGANSNTGHDSGTEPGSAFGYNNRQAEIDFGYRAVHLTVMAGKSLVDDYYGSAPQYSYFEGCSTGGRQGLMEAQRFPYDFDGIVAGAPVNFYQAMNAAGVWHLQRMAANNHAGNLAVDRDGDGDRENLDLVNVLHERVLQQCDADDGIRDGVIDNPYACDFDPATDLNDLRCGDSNNDACFTEAQLQTVADYYRGPYDSNGQIIYPGKMRGSELDWLRFIPHADNNNTPGMLSGPAGDHVNYLFYETDPGVPIPDLSDLDYQARKSSMNPEYHWMEFSVDDFTAGEAQLMSSITDATDPDLTSFLRRNNGKLILYHGFGDALSVASATVAYYEDMVAVTYADSMNRAQQDARLFLAPGMGHCGGGAGPNSWDKLAPLVDWVENGAAPDSITATHTSNGRTDNERPLCPFPQQARYIGPEGSQNDPQNWMAGNFQCEVP